MSKREFLKNGDLRGKMMVLPVYTRHYLCWSNWGACLWFKPLLERKTHKARTPSIFRGALF